MSCSESESCPPPCPCPPPCCPSSCEECLRICVVKPPGANLEYLLPTYVKFVRCIDEACADVLVVIGPDTPNELCCLFTKYRNEDAAFDRYTSLVIDDSLGLPVIYAPTVTVTDYHDVRVYHDAAIRGFNRVVASQYKNPLLILPRCVKFNNAQLVSVLGALQAVYVPLQNREDCPHNPTLIDNLWLLVDTECKGVCICREVAVLATGRFVFWDVAMADPERMTPIKIEDYVYELFKDGTIMLEVICHEEYLMKEFPLFFAVNRAAHRAVKRHQGRIILMEYVPPCEPRKALMLAGKGVTFDTGGVTIKFLGSSGASRDKSGAATVIGLMQMVRVMQPRDIHVIGALGLTKNAVGEEAYVPDEIVKARSGIKVRFSNTDAEGRLVLSDLTTFLREQALAKVLPCPHIFSIGTLTRHARLVFGDTYAIVMDNSVANAEDHGIRIQFLGTEYGEPHEISLLHKDDFDANMGKIIGEDLVQSVCRTHQVTHRAHQTAAAFIIQSSRMFEHERDSCYPIKFTHFDICGSASNYPEVPASHPMFSIAKVHLYNAAH